MKNRNSVLGEGSFSLSFGNSGEIAHFYQANGFPLGIYQPLLSRLGQNLNLHALALRPTWSNIGDPPQNRSWEIYANDLILYIEANFKDPIIAIGHSMGATCTAIAAKARPDLFKALVLIEPAMVSKPLAWLISISPKVIMNKIEPVRSTLKRREIWSSRDEFEKSYRIKSMFKGFNEEAMEALIQYGITETADGNYKFDFPRLWEAHNYRKPPNIMRILTNLDIPCVAIRGKPSIFLSESMWQEWKSHSKRSVFFENLEQGHLFPLENPENCNELIQKGLSAIKID